ncbi:tetratricopeptide repeat protein [Marinimicrobium alkaliphilum]|uniref:tetratricopeptide repeat protein n=1 Tax=Marinimicrobium alkaliphilum TaxID=2202654 RepID=UPI000DB96CBD|nr:hypothetical protein [Marinimicrobium alkaliphilum]
MRIRYPFLLLLLLFPLAFGAAGSPDQHGHDHPVPSGEALGAVNFQPACAAEAAAEFDRALALKHHMMYQQARSRFRALTEQAPGCAMAHWGVAATYFQPLWPSRPDAEVLAEGRAAIAQARRAGTDVARETALIDAVDAFFQTDASSYRERIVAWAEGMAEAYAQHPKDLDIAALYGLSRLALAMGADGETRHALHDEGEAVLRAVWESERTHPGAIHYSIHATDVDGRAENAIDMVAVYGDIAPRVPHALHMPSHIYVRLGAWDEVIEWNRRSADAAKGHAVNGAVSFHYIHALDYLVYGYLQQNAVEQAQAAWAEAKAVERHQPVFVSAFHVAAMPARIAVEQRDWAAARTLPVREPDYLPWEDSHWPEGLSWYARGLGAVHEGDLTEARRAEQRLESLRDAAVRAGEEQFSTYLEVDRQILSGWIAHADGDPDGAIALMHAAAELEATVEKSPVSPGALYPPYEALGDLLLALERPDEALSAYQSGEAIWPGRRNTQRGMAEARALAVN